MITFSLSRSARFLFSSAVLAAAACTANSQASSGSAPATQDATAGTSQSRPQLEPKAIEILKAACAKLAAAHSMSFTALVTTRARVVSAFLWPTAQNRMSSSNARTNFECLHQEMDLLRISITTARR